MKRLSEFTDTKDAPIIMDFVMKCITNEEVRKVKRGENSTVSDVLNAMVKFENVAMMSILAFLNGKTLEEYKSTLNLGTLLCDVQDIYLDDDLMSLFGLRMRSMGTVRSASATESTEDSGKAKKQ